jgi:hypothetical protein
MNVDEIEDTLVWNYISRAYQPVRIATFLEDQN